MPEPVQPSLRRLRAFGIRPNRELGQNFLVDSNLLGVIGRAAELAPEDVVLEIGGGPRVLSGDPAGRPAPGPLVEIDPRPGGGPPAAPEPPPHPTVHPVGRPG